MLLNINLDIITPKLKDIIIKAIEDSTKYKSTLQKYYIELATISPNNETLDVLISNILNSVKSSDVIALIFSEYLRIISFRDIEVDDEDNVNQYYHCARVYKILGVQVINLFYSELYSKYKSTVKDENNLKRYKDWFNSLDKYTLLYHKNEEVYVTLGGKLIDILLRLELLIKDSKYKKQVTQSFIEIPNSIKVLLEKKNTL